MRHGNPVTFTKSVLEGFQRELVERVAAWLFNLNKRRNRIGV